MTSHIAVIDTEGNGVRTTFSLPATARAISAISGSKVYNLEGQPRGAAELGEVIPARQAVSIVASLTNSNQAEWHAPLKTSTEVETGFGFPNFARASVATEVDYEGVRREILAGEARFGGTRRVRNRIVNLSEKLTDTVAWTATRATVSHSIAAPNASGIGHRITEDGTAASTHQVIQTNALGLPAYEPSRRYVARMLVKQGSAGRSPNLVAWDGVLTHSIVVNISGATPTLTSGASYNQWWYLDAGNGWWWIFMDFTASATASNSNCGVNMWSDAGASATYNGDNASYILCGGFMLEDITGQFNPLPSEYVPVGVPVGTTGAESVGYCPGTSGAGFTTPDTAAVSITGDLTIIEKLNLPQDLLTPAAQMECTTKWLGAGNNRSFMTSIVTSGRPYISWCEDGTSGTVKNGNPGVTFTSVGLKPYVDFWLKTELDVDNGAGGHTVKHFYCFDYNPVTDRGDWTQMGTTYTGAGTTTVFDGTALLGISWRDSGATNPLNGNVKRSILRSGIGHAAVTVADFNPADADSDIGTFTSSTTGEVWTVQGTARIRALQNRTDRFGHLPGNSADYFANSAHVTGTGDLAVAVRCRIDQLVTASSQTLVCEYGAAGNRSWTLWVSSAGDIRFSVSADGTNLVGSSGTSSNLPASYIEGHDWVWILCTLESSTGYKAWYYSLQNTDVVSEVNWVFFGSVATGVPHAPFAGSAVTWIGRDNAGTPLKGAVRRALVWNSQLTTVAPAFDWWAADHLWTTGGVVARAGGTVTPTGAARVLGPTGAAYYGAHVDGIKHMPHHNPHTGAEGSNALTLTAPTRMVDDKLLQTGGINGSYAVCSASGSVARSLSSQTIVWQGYLDDFTPASSVVLCCNAASTTSGMWSMMLSNTGNIEVRVNNPFAGSVELVLTSDSTLQSLYDRHELVSILLAGYVNPADELGQCYYQLHFSTDGGRSWTRDANISAAKDVLGGEVPIDAGSSTRLYVGAFSTGLSASRARVKRVLVERTKRWVNYLNGYEGLTLVETTFRPSVEDMIDSSVSGVEINHLMDASHHNPSVVTTQSWTDTVGNSGTWTPKMCHVIGGLRALKGYRAERDNTNALTYSNQLDNAVWTKAQVTVTPNDTTGADGALTMDKVLETAVTNDHRVRRVITGITAGAVVSIAMDVKGGLGRGFFCIRALDTAIVGDGGIAYYNVDEQKTEASGSVAFGNGTLFYHWAEPLANGVTRCHMTIKPNGTMTSCTVDFWICTAAGGGGSSYAGDITKGLYMGHAQFEERYGGSTYIETTGASTAPRSADILYYPVDGNVAEDPSSGQSQGWVYTDALYDYPMQATAHFPETIAIDDGTANNRVIGYGYYTGVTYQLYQVVSSGGVNGTAQPIGAGVDYTTRVLCAHSWAKDRFAGSVNGEGIVNDLSGNGPTVASLTRISIGYAISGNTFTQGYVRDAKVGRRQARYTELRQMTNPTNT